MSENGCSVDQLLSKIEPRLQNDDVLPSTVTNITVN